MEIKNNCFARIGGKVLRNKREEEE